MCDRCPRPRPRHCVPVSEHVGPRMLMHAAASFALSPRRAAVRSGKPRVVCPSQPKSPPGSPRLEGPRKPARFQVQRLVGHAGAAAVGGATLCTTALGTRSRSSSAELVLPRPCRPSTSSHSLWTHAAPCMLSSGRGGRSGRFIAPLALSGRRVSSARSERASPTSSRRSHPGKTKRQVQRYGD